jgi:hypothetical protein
MAGKDDSIITRQLAAQGLTASCCNGKEQFRCWLLQQQIAAAPVTWHNSDWARRCCVKDRESTTRDVQQLMAETCCW